ncbi:membrane-targeted effector domain-containing toxin [Pseudomonas cedrina subsp. fulgida]|nr:membrane-targeted effector domain-containing toxin [Pseudomonas cedrina subsp. fulgida]
MIPTPLDRPPTFEEIRNDLGQISDYLLQGDPIRAQAKPHELIELERLNQVLKTSNQTLLHSARALYQAVENSRLDTQEGKALVTRLKAELNTKLIELDERTLIENKSRKTYLTFDAGITALEQEAGLRVKDRLLHPDWSKKIEHISLGPHLRPGLYALTFTYQDARVEVAGAFVLTEQALPAVANLNDDVTVGPVLLFLPARGLEAFDSLAQLAAWLQHILDSARLRQAFIDCLPRQYHELSTAGIWPLTLEKIDSAPLFEHLYNARIDKRRLDIARALSLVDNPARSAEQLYQQLDQATRAALPAYDQRLELRAQALLERSLRYSAPHWYRSANTARRTVLAEHIQHYNQARQALIDFMGPAASPQALARYQLIEQLEVDLDIQDLNPDQVMVTTQRHVPRVGDYAHKNTLTDLALRGLHGSDENPGSDFLEKTTLSYAGKPLPERYEDLTPAYLAQRLKTLQPRLAFTQVQRALHSKPGFKDALQHMLDRRINCLAYAALLQQHITERDYQLIQDLRLGNDPHLSASTLSVHNAQLQDLWVLRQVDSSGAAVRVLLCTPFAPRPEHFMAFDSEIACQTHVLGWSRDNGSAAGRPTMTDYLLDRVALRFREAMAKTLMGLSFKPHEQEYKEVKFDTPCSHADCLISMAGHFLATQLDDHESSTPLWYRSTTATNRSTLLALADDAEGALRLYNADPQSDNAFAGFETYVHQQAKTALNRLLGRRQNDVDPNEIWAYYPKRLVTSTPAPVSYTTLYREGYDDSIGFLNEAFAESATFKGPEGVDLSPLTAQKVAASVRGTWIGQRYIDEVRAKLQNANSPGYAKRRDATLAITQLQMRTAALECQLKGHISSLDRTWLEASIQSMGDTSVAVRGQYPIHRLMIDGHWIIDTFLFSHADNPVLLYTPNAPDHVTFREARLFNYTLKKTSAMAGYLSERAPIQSQARVAQWLNTARQQLPEHIDRTTPSPPRYDRPARAKPLTDLRHELYDMKLQRRIDNVFATTHNRTQMIMGIVWTCVEWVAAIATAPFPVLSLGTGMLLAFKDAMLALDAYHQGDNDAAIQHLIGYLLNTTGAVFTDLRPALGSIKTLGKPRRPSLHGTPDTEAIAVSRQLHTALPSPEDMRPVLFNGQAYWTPTTPDRLGRYLLFINDASSGQFKSTGRLVQPAADSTWIRSGVVGGAPKYQKVSPTDNPLKAYDLNESDWRNVEPLLTPGLKRNLLKQYETPNLEASEAVILAREQLQPLYARYLQHVEKLSQDAEAFFSTPPVVPRPSLPALVPGASSAQFIESLFKQAKGLVIGEAPESLASKQFLIDHMGVLARQGVKRLYIEHLPRDVFRYKLQKLQTKGASRHIEQHLSAVDSAFNLPAAPSPSYLHLMKEARKHGIELKAIDGCASYDLSAAFDISAQAPAPPRSNTLRNFYSHKVIAADRVDQPDTPWVALVEHSRVRTGEQAPGLADLHGAIGLRIDDVADDAQAGIWSDPTDFKLALRSADLAKTPTPPSAPATSSSLPTASHYNDYDIAPSLRESLRKLERTPKGLDTRYASVSGPSEEAFEAFITTRKRLKADAERFFEGYVPPTRPTLPDAALFKTPQAFLDHAYRYSSGLVIGEAHTSEAAKGFLIKHMGDLKKQGVQTLYFEHLQTDLHQLELDTFKQRSQMPDSLKSFLKEQDLNQMRFYDGKTYVYTGPNTYTNILQAANKQGIRVRAIDCSASYYLKGLGESETARITLFNYFAKQVIEQDQAAQGAHKWVAFTGSAHTDTYLGVPGLAPMLGTLSLHIRDTATSLAKGFEAGAWEVASETKWQALRSDFVLKVGFKHIKAAAPFVPADRSRLKHIGNFLIERPSAKQTTLLHKSNSGQIVSTPIQIDDTGRFFIDRWEALKDKRFLSQDTLIQALMHDIHLTPA